MRVLARILCSMFGMLIIVSIVLMTFAILGHNGTLGQLGLLYIFVGVIGMVFFGMWASWVDD